MPEILTSYGKIEDAPESERQYCKMNEDGKVIYDNSGLFNALQSERKTAKQIQKELEELKNLQKKTEEPEKKNEKQAENSEVAELKKRLEIIEMQRKEEAEKSKKLLLQREVESGAEAAGFDRDFVALYNGVFSKDDSGLFVLDSDGTAKINPVTGKRMTAEEFFKEEIKRKPKFSKESASGSNSSFSGQLRQTQISKSEEKEMRERYETAIKNGNINLVTRLEKDAREKGFNFYG